MPETKSNGETVWRLPQVWAAFLLLLIAVTYRLWIPLAEFPQVPLFNLPDDNSGWLGWVPLAGLVASLLAVTVSPNRFRWCWWIVSASLLVLFVLDQHRLQPWAYQSAVYALAFASLPAVTARRAITAIAISVYLYSGLGKLDYQFAHSVGQDLLEVASRPLGGLPDAWDATDRARIALLFPAIELLAGCGLIPSRSRRWAGIIIIGMHATLIGLLGPWGLQHSLGVLTWNALLIVQAILLFVRPAELSVELAEQSRRRFAPVTAYAVIAVVLVAPLGERAGYWDHWLSWALYSPHSSRVDVEIHSLAANTLSDQLRQYLQDDRDGDGWQQLSLGRWSLETLGVPIYPQARYQLGLARQLSARYEWDDSIRVRIRGPANRWSGTRNEQQAIGRQELDQAAKMYWLGR